jgi:hypothetical protein
MAGNCSSRHRATLGVLLVGPVQRALRRQAHGAQQPAHADHRQGDLELAADHQPHHVPGPQRELEGELSRVGAHDQLIQPGDLRPGQLRWPTRHRPGDQRVPATLPELGQLPVHRLTVQPQRRGHILRVRPGLDLLDRPQSQHLKRPVIQFPAVVLARPRSCQIRATKSIYL